MNTAILYFSATGNSRWVAETLALELKKLNNELECFALNKNEIIDLNHIDRCILVFPVYGARMPAYVQKRVLELIPLDIELIIVTTFGFADGMGYFYARKVLQRPIRAYYQIKMFNNICSPKAKTPIRPLANRLAKTTRYRKSY